MKNIIFQSYMYFKNFIIFLYCDFVYMILL